MFDPKRCVVSSFVGGFRDIDRRLRSSEIVVVVHRPDFRAKSVVTRAGDRDLARRVLVNAGKLLRFSRGKNPGRSDYRGRVSVYRLPDRLPRLRLAREGSVLGLVPVTPRSRFRDEGVRPWSPIKSGFNPAMWSGKGRYLCW